MEETEDKEGGEEEKDEGGDTGKEKNVNRKRIRKGGYNREGRNFTASIPQKVTCF
jgi:hypothetical protein